MRFVDRISCNTFFKCISQRCFSTFSDSAIFSSLANLYSFIYYRTHLHSIIVLCGVRCAQHLIKYTTPATKQNTIMDLILHKMTAKLDDNSKHSLMANEYFLLAILWICIYFHWKIETQTHPYAWKSHRIFVSTANAVHALHLLFCALFFFCFWFIFCFASVFISFLLHWQISLRENKFHIFW